MGSLLKHVRKGHTRHASTGMPRFFYWFPGQYAKRKYVMGSLSKQKTCEVFKTKS